MQVLDYHDARYPFGAHGRCLVHPHAFGPRPGMIFYEVIQNPGASVTNASETIATACLGLLAARDPGEVVWIEAYPPEAYRHPRASFEVDLVAYTWCGPRASEPRWRPAPPAIAEVVRRLWYEHHGPALARTITSPSQP